MIGIVDVHCHIIYGVDDGARTLEESKEMLVTAYDEGIRTIIATPHFRRGMFECPMKEIEENYQQVKALGKTVGDGIEVLLGCEYYGEFDMAEAFIAGKRPTMAGSRYVLIEFSPPIEYSQMRAIIHNVVCNGYRPILAHIERYDCLRKKEEHIIELMNIGAEMQINAESIIGEAGHKIKKFCKKMMKKDRIRFIGTDGHDSQERTISISYCANYIEKKMGADYARKILIENPQKIINSGVAEKA